MAQKFALVAAVAVCLIAPLSNDVVAQTVDSLTQPPQSSSTRAPPAAGDNAVQDAPTVTVGRSIPTADGVGTKTVPAKPCTTSARETDGKTTCIGVPAR